MSRTAFSDTRAQHRQDFLKKLNTIPLDSVINCEVIAAVFPPLKIDVGREARVLPNKARKQTGH